MRVKLFVFSATQAAMCSANRTQRFVLPLNVFLDTDPFLVFVTLWPEKHKI